MYGTFAYIWLIFMVNVGNIPYMDPMGYLILQKFRKISSGWATQKKTGSLNWVVSHPLYKPS